VTILGEMYYHRFIVMQLFVCSVLYIVSLLFAVLCYFLITRLIKFMVTLYINNIQHFNFQLMHTTLKK